MGPSDELANKLGLALVGQVRRDEFPGDPEIQAALAEVWPQVIEETNRQMAEFQQALCMSIQQRFGSRTMRYVLRHAEDILRNVESEVVRVDGGALCRCGAPYRDHPRHPLGPTFHYGCHGEILKT